MPHDPLHWILAALQQLDEQGVRRFRPATVDPAVATAAPHLNFASNDYLNLSRDPRVVSAAAAALRDSGSVGAGASALVTGRTPWHEALERCLARFEHQPAAILFPTGYAANQGVIAALAGPGDTVYCDRLNHASLVDGCRLSRARLRIYRHDDLAGLRRELDRPGSGRRLIVTDALFSMDGDLAPLPDLCDLADEFDALLVVDEAHGTGVFGAQGRGVAEFLGVEARVGVRIGTLSKAVGAMGGFVAGSEMLVNWLWNRGRTQMFSTALPPAVCAAAAAALVIIETEPWRRQQLHDLSTHFATGLAAAGLTTVRGANGPIFPVLVNTPERAMHAAAQLAARGLIVAPIRPPTVPRGTSRLRITLQCGHTRDALDELLATLMQTLANNSG